MLYTSDTETGALRYGGIMARVKKEVQTYPDPTPDRQLESPSGWCITGDHDQCKHQFDFGKCGCSCGHNQTQKTTQAFNKLEGNDPRPWKEK